MTRLRQLPERWRRFDVTVRDLPLGLLILFAALLPASHTHGTQLGGLPGRDFDALAVAAVALQCLPLALRRRWPLLCLTLVTAGFAVDQLRGYHSLAGTAQAIALMSAGAHLERRRRPLALLFSAAYVALAIALVGVGGTEGPSEFVMYYLAMALVWGMGSWLRSTRAAEAAHRRRVAEDTRTAERTRIARELHDVVTHHVTAMVVQAEAARYLTAAPDRLDTTLTAVTDTGRRAITDLRHLLDVLDPGYDGEAGIPSAGRLLTLVEQTRQAGQPVEFTEKGTPPESTGSADLVAYRVVQEALTNALKHARGSATSVEVHHGAGEITVAVSTAGAAAPAASPGGSGRGLAGLRERVDVLGGEFSAGGETGRGFVVRARIPAGSVS
ncbi:sensor histidine kinase [Streptomyces sp. CMB-StM0423]|uniref:sensor histidine kinase n=1 Tax=Streptomyces sp. CMB-StM0423 TaxID=2059884 RepID=UPI000C7017B9|nr:histidine kinase [Streptomyces sp. CMB-StM0423]AUH40862.1 two-component sensor histidine kinase [Streptomyces sp. CMB-StM0423]